MSVQCGSGVASAARVLFCGVVGVLLSPCCVLAWGCSMSVWVMVACLLSASVSAEERFVAASLA
eukprot:14565489-Alexandrium_andersonii.AAC.1